MELNAYLDDERRRILGAASAERREQMARAEQSRTVYRAWNAVCGGTREGAHVTGLRYLPDSNELLVYLDAPSWTQEMSMLREIIRARMEREGVSLDGFKGKTVVLNFWATWCPPCRGEMPEFDELHKEFQKTGEAVLLAVNLTDGRRETPERVAEFLKETGYTMTVLLDEKQEAASFFGVRYIPTTFVLDKDGKLIGQIQGATTKDAVLKLVRGENK